MITKEIPSKSFIENVNTKKKKRTNKFKREGYSDSAKNKFVFAGSHFSNYIHHHIYISTIRSNYLCGVISNLVQFIIGTL